MFSDNLKHILIYEGGYVNNKNDPGGATNFGITQRTYDSYTHKDVRDITPEEVSKIYEQGYWLAAKCDKIDSFMPITALCHFDCAVNQGADTACRLIQRAINIEGGNLVVDGILGSKTFTTMAGLFDSQLCKSYLQIRKDRYDGLVVARPNMKEFISSWYHRLDSIAKIGKLDWRTG